mmetsp:Transcript_22410/g.27662  ORF Transcript_22410/g.27662 Transcript_22410/m.27662 type:complete len:98 (+) Transcript_22410:163-456(+)|eukprot:CAMPEP_0172498496 /NCGR_PEP_ID=MMETSP1066-20121228/113470_1 /TAXON_ID=671091 /ORGANISM="Coscinodiscus wailesii, Strain CCMP2513" /LENGTH=97 /DNA_ID=CAMNT_0013271787 /DNA_START=149 /DNA_END=442 /DNA_ORIENTATION=+
MKFLTLLPLLLTSTQAFAPAPSVQQRLTVVNSEATGKSEPQELLIDEDFDDVDLKRLLGPKTVSKMIKKYNRQLNARKEKGEVVYDEASGYWVPKTE